ncbi:MAG: hypothetical protein U0414_13855 [Polyangiaceae bacterium]
MGAALAGCAEQSAPTSGSAVVEKPTGTSGERATASAIAVQPPAPFASAAPGWGNGEGLPMRAPPKEGERAGGKRLRGRVKAATAASASGRLSASDVEAAIDANIGALGACVGDEGAVVTLRALVAPSGQVVEASASRSTPDDPRLRDCVVAAFRRISFPGSTGGAASPLAFDLSLENER